MSVIGVVRTWRNDEGWGVIDSAETPGGCWAHFSAVAMPGYRSLQPGAPVELDWEQAEQDGFHYRAVRAWPQGQEPYTVAPADPTGAYSSSLRIVFDESD